MAVVLGAVVVFLALAAWASGVAAVAGHAVPVDASGNLVASPAKGSAGDTFQTFAFLSVLVSWVAWLAVQVPRYRRSAGERRQQLKWLYIGAVVFVIAVLAPGGPGTSALVYALDVVGLAVLPVCMGVAVLRYRLYEIDRIISRVISYAVLTALLAGLFAGVVLLATDVLPFKTTLAVAASTLAVAALFNPLRKRVQRTVDRRFNRARYDADQMVAAFAARLKDAVDLDSVRYDLASAVYRALEPAHVSVWIDERH